jgi:hypothetical protein
MQWTLGFILRTTRKKTKQNKKNDERQITEWRKGLQTTSNKGLVS